MNIVKLIIGLVVAAALVVFGAQNTQSVTFQFLAWDTPSVPVVLALAIAVLVGVLLAWAVSIPGRIQGWRTRRELQHEVASHDRPAAAESEAPPGPADEDNEPRS